MNENNVRNIINQDSLILIGMIMIVVVIGSISSYAYVTWTGRDESGGLTTTIGNLATITFDKGVNLSSNNLTPVLNYQDGIHTTFNINKKIDSDVYLKAALTINEIDENLKNPALKYILLKSDDNNIFESIAKGDFSEIETNEIALLEDYQITTTVTYYKLYIYIDGRQNNTDMINKTLDVTLNVGANKDIKNPIEATPITSDTLETTPTSPLEQQNISAEDSKENVLEESSTTNNLEE